MKNRANREGREEDTQRIGGSQMMQFDRYRSSAYHCRSPLNDVMISGLPLAPNHYNPRYPVFPYFSSSRLKNFLLYTHRPFLHHHPPSSSNQYTRDPPHSLRHGNTNTQPLPQPPPRASNDNLVLRRRSTQRAPQQNLHRL